MNCEKPDSKEPTIIEPALPSWAAYVIQLSHDTTPDSGIFAGRIEHLSSGRRARVGSTQELLAALEMMLDQVGEEGPPVLTGNWQRGR